MCKHQGNFFQRKGDVQRHIKNKKEKKKYKLTKFKHMILISK